ncbi:hypothetical protein ATK17_2566 [Branchiibius hedensis]|uniref:Uncharacterized protein n=1 Tax=Branchiibius hedensis TaxID=672460 RepID=A0A2Y8ZUN8_9MICO|nr:hypothetical protein [Branchiibius hedensis]PWJ26404.1 hypothetical protein ATK17_2566 [Branchiibius hedensis]SSA35216.1 hypothetical protein SAMN04489750_2566 [Branchiibius hedensis]
MSVPPGQIRRIARMFRWYILAGAAVVVVCAIGFWVLLLTSGRTFHGTGATGSAVTIVGSASGPARLQIYTDRPATTECTPNQPGVYFYPADLLAGVGQASTSLQHDGRSWYYAGYLTDGWRAGQTVTCPASDGQQVLLSVDGAATWRPYALGLTGGSIILMLGAAVFVALGRDAR